MIKSCKVEIRVFMQYLFTEESDTRNHIPYTLSCAKFGSPNPFKYWNKILSGKWHAFDADQATLDLLMRPPIVPTGKLEHAGPEPVFEGALPGPRILASGTPLK